VTPGLMSFSSSLNRFSAISAEALICFNLGLLLISSFKESALRAISLGGNDPFKSKVSVKDLLTRPLR